MKKEIVVIKYGGSVQRNKALQDKFLNNITKLHKKQFIVIVHGGGVEITSWLEKFGIKSKFIHGLRYTDKFAIPVIEMVLCGKISYELVTKLNRMNIPAVGISGKDGNLVICERIKNLGYVGQPVKVNPELILTLLTHNFLPVISSIGYDRKNCTVNINADTMATTIAIRVKASRIVFFTDVPGILNFEGKVISKINTDKIYSLIDKGIIKAGMVPKILACKEAVEKGVKQVCITNNVTALFVPMGTIIAQ